jgi:DNA-binding HxlR family transcriptional regulator
VKKDSLIDTCPAVIAQKVLSGKWTLVIMYFLSKETLRFNELQKKLDGLTAVTLSKHLQELEQKQLIVRQSYNQVPPRLSIR